ncbi:actin-like isoform X1 [Penaeus monodon]|uniref:actin-like isoform X1 n=1 Tax=Penaeus monodon TaxID=6687 RepID=UPI0018A7C762|nr:actin-like isoform X1 [Penaeus monodon]
MDSGRSRFRWGFCCPKTLEETTEPKTFNVQPFTTDEPEEFSYPQYDKSFASSFSTPDVCSPDSSYLSLPRTPGSFLSSVVVDVGSDTLKAGFSRDDSPRAVFSSCVTRPRHEKKALYPRPWYAGDARVPRADVFSRKFPVENGVISDWDDMTKLWQHTFENELKVDPKENPLLLVVSAHNASSTRELILETMFESFHVPALYLANPYVLALCSSGRTSGVVMDSGDGVSHAVPILEGTIVPHALQRLDVGGRCLTDYMLRILAEQGHAFKTSEGQSIAREVKEKLCYVMTNSYHSFPFKETYTLPGGGVITVGRERFLCPEGLFHPSNLGLQGKGIHEVLNSAVLKCDPAVRKLLYKNITLSGGNTLFPCLEERLLKELVGLSPPGTKIKIVVKPRRHFGVWCGGAIVASHANFQKLWISKELYDEVGPAVLNLRS